MIPVSIHGSKAISSLLSLPLPLQKVAPNTQRKKPKNTNASAAKSGQVTANVCGYAHRCFIYKDFHLVKHGDTYQNAVKDKGLEGLLDQARKENPLKEPPRMS
jgi:hypothetical protein